MVLADVMIYNQKAIKYLFTKVQNLVDLKLKISLVIKILVEESKQIIEKRQCVKKFPI